MASILSLLYLIIGIIYLLFEYRYIKRYNTLQLVSLFRTMFAFVNGFLPSFILWKVEEGNATVLQYFSYSEITDSMVFMLPIALVEYIILTLCYNKILPSKYYKTEEGFFDIKSVDKAIFISLIVGFVALWLWTKAYGSIYGMMIEANLVRSRSADVYNEWAFLEHVARIFTPLFFLSIAAFFFKKSNSRNLFFNVLYVILSLIGGLTVMTCTDSRGEIGIICIVLILYYFIFYKFNDVDVIKQMFSILLLLCGTFALIIMSDQIMNSVRGIAIDKDVSQSFGDIIEKEFGFVVTTQVNAFHNITLFSSLFWNDFINGILSWIPSRFISFERPINLWDYSTELLMQRHSFYGQSPVDFVSASIYLFGISGVFILPSVLGYVLKKCETKFRRLKFSVFHSAFYGYMCFLSIWWGCFFSFASTIKSLFGFFVIYLILKFVYNSSNN